MIKYPVTLFLLLLIGYSQLFAHIYRGAAFPAPSIKSAQRADHDGMLVIKANELEDIYIEEEEEENERNSSRRYTEAGQSSQIIFWRQPNSYQRLSYKSGTSFFKHFSPFSAYKSLNVALSVFRI